MITCSYTFPYGTNVHLTETPASGSTFDSWSGGGPYSQATTYDVTLTQNPVVHALFTGHTSVIVTAASVDSGSGTVLMNPPGPVCFNSPGASQVCVAHYAPMTDVTLTATPAPNSTFAGWTGACASFAMNSVCTVTANLDVVAGALFRGPQLP
jgi:hypothetical protein